MITELTYLYPTAIPNVDFTLQDDGTGPYIKTWDSAKLGAQPTATTISNASTAAALAVANAETNASIQGQIDALEKTQARPIREAALGIAGAQARVQTIDDQIAALRSKFVR